MIDRKNIPVVVECSADNGEHSHFKLIDVETGACLWEESETAHNSDHAATLSDSPKFPEYDYVKDMFPHVDTLLLSTIYHAIRYSGNFA